MNKTIKSLVKELLEFLGIVSKKIEVATKDEGWTVNLTLDEADKGILIGYHGETISAIQSILNLLFFKKTGEWAKIIVNIGDYRQKREEALIKLAQETVAKVKLSGQPMALFNLNPFERRTIHALLGDDEAVTTESEGEGNNRHLIIRLK